MELLDWLGANSGTLSIISTLVTAAATAALVYVTWVLAVRTTQMAKAGSSPSVLVNIVPNRWAANHADQVVVNSGNGAAFDVRILMRIENNRTPDSSLFSRCWTTLDVMHPGQMVIGYAGSFANIFPGTIHAEVSWAETPGGVRREAISYSIRTAGWEANGGPLGGDPLVRVADEIRKLRDDWKPVASGAQKLAVDIHDREDRALVRREDDARVAANMEKLVEERR